MQHKKQFYEQLVTVFKWNKDRGNTSTAFSKDLENSLLLEECNEYIAATSPVEQLDALMDLQFVIHGTLYKMGLSPQQVVDSYQAVIKANNNKANIKNSQGKITKPENFTGPEADLQKILDERSP